MVTPASRLGRAGRTTSHTAAESPSCTPNRMITCYKAGRTEHLFKPAPHTDGDSGLMNVPTKLEEQIRAGSRRRRFLIATVAVVGLLLANAVAVGQQAAEATSDSTLPLDGGNIYVRQDGPRDAPASS